MTKLTLKTTLSPETLAKLSHLTNPKVDPSPSNATASKTQGDANKKSKPKAPQPAPKKTSNAPKEGIAIEKAEKEKAWKNFWAAKKWLESSFPKAFNFKEPIPLKIGIRQDLLNVESPFSRTQRSKALCAYLYNLKYLNAVANGEFRYDLNGEQVEEISEEHKEHSRIQVALIKEARAKSPAASS